MESDPELRGRFQFWVFAYPITLSALRLRKSLAQICQLYPRTKGMILRAGLYILEPYDPDRIRYGRPRLGKS